MSLFTLQIGSTEQSLDAWGAVAATLRFAQLADDTLQVTLDRPLDVGLETPFAAVILRRDSVVVFRGVLIDTLTDANADEESQTLQCAGLWWYLRHIVFQQDRRVWSATAEDFVLTLSSRVIFGEDLDGSAVTTGQNLNAILDYAISAGAPLAKGTISPNLVVTSDEGTDVTCAEAIERVLRWHPDHVISIDYAPSVPTISIVAASTVTPVEIPLTEVVSRTNPRPRRDLQVPAVIIHFSRTDEVDGESLTVLDKQVWPEAASALQPRAIVLTVDLQGGSSSYLSQRIETALVEETDADWWRGQVPWLAAAEIENLVVHSGSKSEAFTRSLTSGAMAEWMNVASGLMTVSAVISYEKLQTTGIGAIDNRRTYISRQRVDVRVVGTNAASGLRTSVESFVPAEEVPAVNIAQALHGALSVLQWEGLVEFAFEESAADRPLRLNITGGASAWASMGAYCQDVAHDLLTGVTTIGFGPHRFLTAGDLVDLLRVNRPRRQPSPSVRIGRATGAAAEGLALPTDAAGSDQGVSSSTESERRVQHSAALTMILQQESKVGGDPPSGFGSQTASWRVVDVASDSGPRQAYAYLTGGWPNS